MKLREHMQIERRTVKHLFSLSKRCCLSTAAGSVVTSLMPYVPIYFSARLIDALAAGEGIEVLALYASLTVGLVALLSLLNSWITVQYELGSKEQDRGLNWVYAEKAMGMSYASIEDREVSLLRERIKYETQTGFNEYCLIYYSRLLVGYVVQMAASVSLSISFFTLSTIPLWQKLAFVGVVIATVLVNILLTSKRSKTINAFYSKCVDLNLIDEKFFSYVDDYRSGKDIRLYGLAWSLAEFDLGKQMSIWRQEAKMELKCLGLKLLDTLVNYGLQLGVYIILIAAALGGGVSVGSIARYASCVLLLLTAAAGAATAIQSLLVNDQYLKRYFEYLDIPNPMYQGSLTVVKRDDNEYYIEFRDVSFRYPNTENYALRHVNLKFRVGEKLAVVGMNGSGKTTFIKLLCRMYDPTEGEICLNGVDIRKYDYDEYMALFSIVFQDFQLMAFSLGQNVSASAAYDRTRAEECLERAGFDGRLSDMPKGLDTVLYQHFDREGVEISGGEAQKVALARALYKDAPFIILDEPTAALDPVSEYEVYSKFDQIAGDKTAVYISHRLASCRFCSEILVFDSGNIVQRGSHDELMADESGKYHALWNAQAQYYSREAG
jgi:ATP-binding cassette subfamily B protein